LIHCLKTFACPVDRKEFRVLLILFRGGVDNVADAGRLKVGRYPVNHPLFSLVVRPGQRDKSLISRVLWVGMVHLAASMPALSFKNRLISANGNRGVLRARFARMRPRFSKRQRLVRSRPNIWAVSSVLNASRGRPAPVVVCVFRFTLTN